MFVFQIISVPKSRQNKFLVVNSYYRVNFDKNYYLAEYQARVGVPEQLISEKRWGFPTSNNV